MLLGRLLWNSPGSPVAPVMAASRRAFRVLGLTSGVINLLTLTGSIYMMQVYDRVLGSQSVPTLVGLSVLALAAFAFQGWLEIMRGRILALVGEKLDVELSPKVQAAGLKIAMSSPTGSNDGAQAIRDMEAIRSFITGTGVVAALDMPWLLLYVVFASLLHPLFGLTTVVAAVGLIWLTWRTEVQSREPLKAAHEANVRRNQISEANLRGAEVILANGMRANRLRRWQAMQVDFLAAQRQASFVVSGYSSLAKTVRIVLQSFILGLGAYLAIKGQITSGAIIAGSIMVSRALSPIDQAIASWRPFVAARQGHARLTELMAKTAEERVPFELPPPSQSIAVKDLAVVPPGGQAVTLAGVSFTLEGGQVLGIIGPSGSGKSTLVKALVGAWKPARGAIAFGGKGPEQWSEEALGAAVGYLPQDVQLFEGTIAENISRFDPKATPEKIVEAAQAAGLDRVIGSEFPKTGYDTPVGLAGAQLSGGMRQRIGLARVMYGRPFLVVLDEPNSNLDAEGRAALRDAIKSIRERRGIVILVTHQDDILSVTDLLLTMTKGMPEFLGPRAAVLDRWRAKYLGVAASPGGNVPPRAVPQPGQSGDAAARSAAANTPNLMAIAGQIAAAVAPKSEGGRSVAANDSQAASGGKSSAKPVVASE